VRLDYSSLLCQRFGRWNQLYFFHKLSWSVLLFWATWILVVPIALILLKFWKEWPSYSRIWPTKLLYIHWMHYGFTNSVIFLIPKALNNVFGEHRNFGQLTMNGGFIFFLWKFHTCAEGVASRPNDVYNFWLHGSKVIVWSICCFHCSTSTPGSKKNFF